MAICSISVMHIYQASLLIYAAATANATPIAALIYAFVKTGDAAGLPDLVWWLPWVLIASACIALVGAVFRFGWIRLALFLPQHLFLAGQMAGCVAAMIHGAYLDNTIKPWEHISADQAGVIALFVIHSSAILRRCRDPNG